MELFLEDLPDNWQTSFGSYTLGREEVVEFAGRYDPQDFHLDDEAAARGPFGRLTASGWHTSAIAMRMMVDEFDRIGLRTLGSPGVEAINFLKPVHPGDTLSSELAMLERRPSNSRPDRMISSFRTVLRNQHGDVVWTCRHTAFHPRRRAEA